MRLTREDLALSRWLFSPIDKRKAVRGWLVAGPVEALVPESERCPVVLVRESAPAMAGSSEAATSGVLRYAQSEEGRRAASARGRKRWRVCPTHRKAET